MMNNTRELFRFHFLKLVPGSVASVWASALTIWGFVAGAFTILIVGWPDTVNGKLEVEYPFYGLLPLVYTLFFLFCFGTVFAFSQRTDTAALNHLPLRRGERLMLRLADSSAVTLVWTLIPALLFFGFSSWDRVILAHLIALWLTARIVQAILYAGAAFLSPWWGDRFGQSASSFLRFIVFGVVFQSWVFFFKPKFAGPANEWIASLPSPDVLLTALIPMAIFSWLVAWAIANVRHPADSLGRQTNSVTRVPTSVLLRKEISPQPAGTPSVLATLSPALLTLAAFVLVTSPLYVAEAFGEFRDRFRSESGESAVLLATITTILFLFPLLVFGILARRLYYRIRLFQILPIGTAQPIATILFLFLAAAVGMGIFMSVFEGDDGNLSMRWFFPMMMTAILASGGPICIKMGAPITPREVGAKEIDPEGAWVAVGAYLVFMLMLLVPLRSPDFEARLFVPFFSMTYAYGIWAMTWMYRRY